MITTVDLAFPPGHPDRVTSRPLTAAEEAQAALDAAAPDPLTPTGPDPMELLEQRLADLQARVDTLEARE